MFLSGFTGHFTLRISYTCLEEALAILKSRGSSISIIPASSRLLRGISQGYKDDILIPDWSTRFIFYKNTFYKNNQAQIWKK